MGVKIDSARVYESLGDALVQLNLLGEAKEAYEQSMRLRDDVVKAQADSAQAKHRLAISYEKLGEIALRTNDLKAAELAYDKSLAVHEELAGSAPKNSLAQVKLSIAYGRLGDLYDSKHEPIKARNYFQKALPPMEAFASAYPQNRRVKRDRAVLYFRLALMNRFLDADAEARDFREKALNEFGEAAKNSPNDGMAQFDLGAAHRTFGNIDISKYDFVSALGHFESGVACFRQLEAAGRLRGNSAWEQMLQDQLTNLAHCRRMIAASVWPRVAYLALAVSARRPQASPNR
jgi:tetratricopeptide (TPR) repeat protein